MNQRIRELARQAGFYSNPDVEKFEKFAELIVRESIEVMKQNDYHGEWLGEKIKQHFGVKP
jgi:hypothetical protein